MKAGRGQRREGKERQAEVAGVAGVCSCPLPAFCLSFQAQPAPPFRPSPSQLSPALFSFPFSARLPCPSSVSAFLR